MPLRIVTEQDVLNNLQCDDEVKYDLIRLLDEHQHDPRKVCQGFISVLKDTDWSWQWLDEYPDTLSIWNTSAEQLLADTLLKVRSPAMKRIQDWNQERQPYLLILGVRDEREPEECKRDYQRLIKVGKGDPEIMLPHRPGCRCYPMMMDEKRLARAYPELHPEK